MATDTADPTTDPGAPPASSSNRFFGWMRATGVVRQPGWIGGVCAGIAERLGIDPLIVRGIAVVVAVLGGPAILLYAAAWLLLPDRFDRIHLEQLFRGKVDAPIAAIGVLIILSLLPVTEGFWSIGAAYWHGGATIGRVIWTIVLLAAAVGVIVWVARHHTVRVGSSPVAQTDVATSAAPATTPEAASPDSSSSAAVPTETVPLATPPMRPGADATTADFAAWREQQAAWKAERSAFQAQEIATIRETNLARARERREAAAARSLEYLERQARWRKANPRLPGAIVATTVGVAIIAGAIAGLVASTAPDWRDAEIAVGFGTATIVLGVVIVVAAAFGRRNGFLVFLSVVTLLATAFSAAVPVNRQLVWPQLQTSTAGSFSQLAGYAEIFADPGTTGVIDLWQGAGSTNVNVLDGETVRFEFTTPDRSARVLGLTDAAVSAAGDGSYEYSRTFGPGAEPDLTIRVWQGVGSIFVSDENEKADTK